jgi:hypothetical protein
MEPVTIGAAFAGAVQVANQVQKGLKGGIDQYKEYRSYFKNGSLIDIAQVARVEPLLIVDADVINLEYLPEVSQSLQSMFSGYYLQAINLLGTIGGISVAKRLAPLNPNRGFSLEEHTDWRMSAKSYAHRLPTTHNKQAFALESLKSDNFPSATTNDAITTMREASNLSVGKMYKITLKEGDNQATIDVAIRLMASVLPTSSMVNLFTFKDSFDMDLGERYHAWKAGRLSFFKDLILCRDLIDKHRSAMLKDNSNVYAEILGRQNDNWKAGLVNANPSLATASNLAILSTETLALIEQKLNGKFSNFKVRNQLFDNTNLMILAVIDREWDRVTFYHRGIEASTQVSVRDMKVSNKGNGPDVSDILKAYMSGSAPNM